MPLQPVDPDDYNRDVQTVCCDDVRWHGCPHPITEHDGAGSCTVRGCRCAGLVRHRDGCVHTPPAPDEG